MGDPRLYQMAVLSSLLAYGALALGLDLRPGPMAAIAVSALGVQWLGSRGRGMPFDPRSAGISALSLCLLLRTDSAVVAAAAAAIAIGSKFTLRIADRHFANPSALGLVACLLWTNRAWISTGQWGSAAWFGLLVACAAGVVLQRARRGDVALAFLGWHAALLFGRALWLGDPWAIPIHALQSGSLLVFAFFMISDPKTTPATRAGRVVFAGIVAGVDLGLRFGLYEPNALLYSLVACAPLVPAIDRIFPAHSRARTLEGEHHATNARPRDLAVLRPVG
jgi:Na+-transporting NADH:ubiquinone oxidoreductase subunit NqrB